MYAAAGGASLASRQARQRQRQQKKTQQLQAKLHPPKALALAAAEHSTPTRQSRQFHQLPTNYLRTPQAQARKLSASYTAHSKLLLPIDEGDDVQSVRMHSHIHMSHSHIHMSHSHSHGVPEYQQRHTHAKLIHRHSGSSAASYANYYHSHHLPKSATATLPLVSQVAATPPSTPTGAVAVKTSAMGMHIDSNAQHDAIIVTPATPMASPGHAATEISKGDEEPAIPPIGPLERKCSVYRMRRSDAFELDMDRSASIIKRTFKEEQLQYEPLLTDEPQLIGFKGRKWQVCAYCEEGICVCEHYECAQGRAAWLERGRRCSVQESQPQATCHRRWVKRNRIQDISLGGSSDDEDFLSVLRGPSTFANAFLYVGLGTIALGLVIAFVGTGEKGFKTVELRLIGPSLIGLGLICCILRILFCICPSHCISSSKKGRKKNCNKVDADHTTSLLRGENKRVSIARRPSMQTKYPIAHKRSSSKMLNEGMEALRQIATTSLFLQNEQKPSLNRVVPVIKEPESGADKRSGLEMKRLETSPNLRDVGYEDNDDFQWRIERQGENITQTDAKASKLSESSRAYDTKSATTNEITSSPVANAHKHFKQRIAVNNTKPQQKEISQLASNMSPSRCSKESIDPIDHEIFVETSLMLDQCDDSSIELDKIKTCLPTGLSELSTIQISKGAVSRVSNATAQTTNYDLPSSTPHSYSLTGSEPTTHNTYIPSATTSNDFNYISNSLSNNLSNGLTATRTTQPTTTESTLTSTILPGQVIELSTKSSPCVSLGGDNTHFTKNETVTNIPVSTTTTSQNLNAFAPTHTKSYSNVTPVNLSPSVSAVANKLEPELLLSPSKLGQ